MKKKPQDATQMAFPTSDAAIQERQITVRVLTIGTKQVTQSLYCQLVEDDELIDYDTCELRGAVWGWVNLHTGCEDDDEHLHVIWEQKGTLKRGVVYQTYPRPDIHQIRAQRLQDWAKAYHYTSALEGIDLFPGRQDAFTYGLTFNGRRVGYTDSQKRARSYLDFMKLIADAESLLEKHSDAREDVSILERQGIDPGFLFRATDSIKRWTDGRNLQANEMRAEIQSIWSAWEPEWSMEKPLPTAAELRAAIEQSVDEIRAFEQAWKKSYADIKASGQLFIAVSGVWK